ncbi:MmpS family transport accessory protein [Mycolicibacterium thermoresistibile]
MLTTGAIAALRLVGADDEEDIATVVVTYELTGPPVSVEVAYWESDDTQSEVQSVTLPWQIQVTKAGDNNYVSVTAMRAEASDEPLRCRISAAGATISQRDSLGSTVTCDGHIGEEE